MRIEQLHSTPIATFPYFHASPRSDNWGNQGVIGHNLPILRATTDDLPKDLDALVLTSDLQGIVIEGEKHTLLGEALPEFMAVFLELEMNLDPQKTGIILPGDFFARLDKRGGLGDVRSVWWAFQKHFRWVAGVGGNHDDIGQNMNEVQNFKKEKGIYYLENEVVTLDKLRVAGISGVIGENGKHLRIPEAEFTKSLKKHLRNRPDLMVLHQNPFHESTPHKGGQCVTDLLLRAPGQLLVCGHAIWDEPFYELANGAQVLNVGERVFVLCRER